MFFPNKAAFSILIPSIEDLKRRNDHNKNLIMKLDEALSKITAALAKSVIDSDMQKDILKSLVEASKERIKENVQNEDEKTAIDVAYEVVKRTIDKEDFGNLY